jgi:ribose transport system substrate-binding protein
VAAINGEDLEEVQDTGSFWYDETNVDSDDITPMLYQ